MVKKERTSVTLDTELNHKAKMANIKPSEAYELGVRISLTGVDTDKILAIASELSKGKTEEEIKDYIKTEEDIEFRLSLDKFLLELDENFKLHREKRNNPFLIDSFKMKVKMCALQLGISTQTMFYIFTCYKKNLTETNKITVDELKNLKIDEKVITDYSERISEDVNFEFQEQLAGRLDRLYSAYRMAFYDEELGEEPIDDPKVKEVLKIIEKYLFIPLESLDKLGLMLLEEDLSLEDAKVLTKEEIINLV